MTDPEHPSPERRDPDSPDPVPYEPLRRSLWQWPLVRGAANGAFFAVMLTVIQVYGFFGPARPLDDESIAGNIAAGVVFGFAMYIIELWRWQRRMKADAAGARGNDTRLRERDPEDGDAAR